MPGESVSAGAMAGASAAPAPVSFADVPPGDTADVLAIMRRTMQQIDGGLGQLSERDTVLPPVADSAPRYVTVWLDGGVPRKLLARDSSETAGVSAETAFWFANGDLSVVATPSDLFAFDAGRIVLWTDQAFMPVPDVAPSVRMARELALQNDADRWLKLFRLALP